MARFDELKRMFKPLYDELRIGDISDFTIPLWSEANGHLEKAFLPVPRRDFLRDPTVMMMMFLSREKAFFRHQLEEVSRAFPLAARRRMLREDLVGYPILAEGTYPTSGNTVHHAYHLARFFTSTGRDPGTFRSVVEWGGGYGNFAKLVRRLTEGQLTYVIVDTPLFVCLQWLYLASIFGQQGVHVITAAHESIQTGKINLVSVAFAREIRISAELFVSTWALSESSRRAQELVADRAWFNASHLLIAFQRSRPDIPDAEHTGELARRGGASIEGIGLLPASSYAFK